MGRRYSYKKLLVLLESTLLLAIETAMFAYIWYSHYSAFIVRSFYRRGNYAVIGIYTLILFLFTKLYGGFKIGYLRVIDVLYSQILSLLCSNAVLYIQLCIVSRDYVSPFHLLEMTVAELGVIFAWVVLCRWVYAKVYPPRRMLLIYGNKLPKNLASKINSRKDKYQVSSMIPVYDDINVTINEIVNYHNVIIYDVPSDKREEIMSFCFQQSIRTYIVPKITDIILLGSEEIHLFDTPLLLQRNQGLSGEQLIIKRMMDILFSFLMLAALSPLMLLTALCVKLQDRGPVLYRQTRLTRSGKSFFIYKFRSMKIYSEQNGARLAQKNDSRVTPVGRILRNLHLDELPQLFNVLKGDMSLVGPRPERPEIAAKYQQYIPEFGFRLKVKAGLTGYAQIYGKYNTTPQDKLKLDLFYIEHYSLWLDLKLLLLTFKILFQKENVEGVDKDQITALKNE